MVMNLENMSPEMKAAVGAGALTLEILIAGCGGGSGGTGISEVIDYITSRYQNAISGKNIVIVPGNYNFEGNGFSVPQRADYPSVTVTELGSTNQTNFGNMDEPNHATNRDDISSTKKLLWVVYEGTHGVAVPVKVDKGDKDADVVKGSYPNGLDHEINVGDDAYIIFWGFEDSINKFFNEKDNLDQLDAYLHNRGSSIPDANVSGERLRQLLEEMLPNYKRKEDEYLRHRDKVALS